jgi:hypothetical protein
MKKNVPVIITLLLAINFACNTAEKVETKDKITVESVVITNENPANEPQSPYDPDPSDTIPGKRYGLNSSSKETADLVRTTLQDKFKSDLEKNLIDSFSRKFIFFEYDLNDDGMKEIFVGLTGPYFCGSGGCTIYLLDNQGNAITKFSVSRDIVIDHKKTNGYKDLFIYSGGKFRIAKFNGKTYPSNPSILQALNVIPGDGLPRALNFVNEPYPWFTF